MDLRNLHKLQLKTAIYQLFTHPGVLTDDDIFETLTEIIEEIGGNNA